MTMTGDAATMADWIAEDLHNRPFFRDPDFVSAFGRPGPAMLRAAVDEMKRRAAAKAQAAGMPIAWNANLHHDNNPGMGPNERI